MRVCIHHHACRWCMRVSVLVLARVTAARIGRHMYVPVRTYARHVRALFALRPRRMRARSRIASVYVRPGHSMNLYYGSTISYY